ncbi:MAG: 30S ribosomal protein S1 [Clostridia bacterium]|nr:30S ribosomal protein S1 [Clostridia bacterium]
MDEQKFMPEGWNLDNVKDEETERKIAFLTEAMEKNETLEGLVTMADADFNLHVDLDGIKGIVPRIEVSSSVEANGLPRPVASITKVNKRVQFKIKEIRRDENGEPEVVLSRRDVENEVREWMFNNLKEGMVLSGIVRNMEQYGVFIDVGGGVTGLLHIEDISVARIMHPSERFKIGDKIKVMVKSFERDTGKIVLTHKELLGTWEDNIKDFREGTTVIGIARAREKNGIFVELRPNLVGLADHKPGVEYGQKVSVFIKKIIPEKKKIKLVIVG